MARTGSSSPLGATFVRSGGLIHPKFSWTHLQAQAQIGPARCIAAPPVAEAAAIEATRGTPVRTDPTVAAYLCIARVAHHKPVVVIPVEEQQLHLACSRGSFTVIGFMGRPIPGPAANDLKTAQIQSMIHRLEDHGGRVTEEH